MVQKRFGGYKNDLRAIYLAWGRWNNILLVVWPNSRPETKLVIQNFVSRVVRVKRSLN